MDLRINNNLDALNAQSNLARTSYQLSRSMERLATGKRINSAADDAAGLGIATRMRAELNGLEQASRNVYDGMNMVETADAGLEQAGGILQRVRELAVQYNNGTNDAQAKAAIQNEVSQLNDQLAKLGDSTRFNGMKLLDSPGGAPVAQVQAGPDSGDTVDVPGADLSADVGTEVQRFSTMSSGPPEVDIGKLEDAINAVAQRRSDLGAAQQQLTHVGDSLASKYSDVSASESRIEDADMAQEAANAARLKMMRDQHLARIAQANQLMSNVLALLH